MNKVTSEDLKNAASEIRDIQIEMAELWERLNETVNSVRDNNAMSYIVEPMKIMIFEDHGFLSSDLNLERVADYYSEQASLLEADMI